MLHYVRGDGGTPVVPVEELKSWLRVKLVSVLSDDIPQCVIDYNEMIYDLLAELEAMGR